MSIGIPTQAPKRALVSYLEAFHGFFGDFFADARMCNQIDALTGKQLLKQFHNIIKVSSYPVMILVPMLLHQ